MDRETVSAMYGSRGQRPKDRLFKWGAGPLDRGILLQFISAHVGTIWGIMLLDNGEVYPVVAHELKYVGLVEYK